MVIQWSFMSHKFTFFLQNCKKLEAINVFYVVAFDPIKILTCMALQNDCQNLSFVKAINVVGKKMARNTRKMANFKLCHFHFKTEFNLKLLFVFFRFSWLPVVEDVDESPFVYGYLCDLIEANHQLILGTG